MDMDLCSQLRKSPIFYVGCRVAFLRTFDCLLNAFISTSSASARRGFLEQVPLFVGTAPQVQLAALLETWRELCTAGRGILLVPHQVVCLCSLCELADTAERNDRRLIHRAIHGPESVDPGDVLWLASRCRLMQMMLPFSSQAGSLQMSSGIAAVDQDPVRSAGGVSQANLASLCDLLGQWHVRPSIVLNSQGLLTATEQEMLRTFFTEHPHLLRESRKSA